MKKNRLQRLPIAVGNAGKELAPASTLPIYKPKIGKGWVDLTVLQEFSDGKEILKCLIDWQQNKRGGKSIALSVRSFLLFTIEKRVQLGAASLAQYRDHLAGNASLADVTRRGYYSNAAGFVKRLIDEGILPQEEIPKGLKAVRKAPKATFIERARNLELIRNSKDYAEWIERVPNLPGLDRSDREVLAVSQGWMAQLEICATDFVFKQMADWNYVNEISADSSTRDYEEEWASERSVRAALGLLMRRYGRLAPHSASWPTGMVYFCRQHGWSVDRLRAALFPTVSSLEAFLVLALANERLSPNVDSVLYYAFVGCVSETEEANQVRVRFEKFRGGAIENTVDSRSALAKAFRSLESIVMSGVQDEMDVRRLSKDGGIPLFIHYLVSGERRELRTVDPSHSSLMVRRFIAKAAQIYPNLEPLVDVVTGENFRPTHFLCRSLRGESIFKIQAVAGHKIATTTVNYLDRVEIESSAARRHWDFQRYLVGEAKKSSVRQLGNGFHCAEGGEEGNGCLRVDLCGIGTSGCCSRRIVLESPKIVAEWIAWSEHIREKADYLKKHRPERWSAIWEPRLLEYEVLLESTSASVRKAALRHTKDVCLMPLE